MTIPRPTERLRGWIPLTLVHLCVTFFLQVGVGAVTFFPDAANELSFSAQQARYVRLVIVAGSGSQPCIARSGPTTRTVWTVGMPSFRH